MVFMIGFVLGLYTGVLVMSLKFKKQLKKMETTVHMPTGGATTETFTAENLVGSAKTEEE